MVVCLTSHTSILTRDGHPFHWHFFKVTESAVVGGPMVLGKVEGWGKKMRKADTSTSM